MDFGEQSQSNDLLVAERSLPEGLIGNPEESYAAGDMLDHHHLQSSILSASGDGVNVNPTANAIARKSANPIKSSALIERRFLSKDKDQSKIRI